MNKAIDSTIKTLWVGDNLSLLEQLSLRSFVACGHTVELFTYNQVAGIPNGVAQRDANDILPESSVFRYKYGNSVAGFANWFRYKMLFDEGGTWVDTDVICLKPFDFCAEIFFGKEEHLKFNNAVIGGKKEHPLFEFMANQAAAPNNYLPYDTPKDKRRKWKRKYLQGNERGNVMWGEVGPLGISKAIEHMKLAHYGLPYTAFYPIHPMCWDSIFDNTYSDPAQHFPDSYAIHLWREMFRSIPGFNKNGEFPKYSLIEALKKKYL